MVGDEAGDVVVWWSVVGGITGFNCWSQLEAQEMRGIGDIQLTWGFCVAVALVAGAKWLSRSLAPPIRSSLCFD